MGTKPAAATSPVHPALPVAVVTRMPTPTVSIQVPMFETKAPAHSSAKRRCRNGANDGDRFTGPTVPGYVVGPARAVPAPRGWIDTPAVAWTSAAEPRPRDRHP